MLISASPKVRFGKSEPFRPSTQAIYKQGRLIDGLRLVAGLKRIMTEKNSPNDRYFDPRFTPAICALGDIYLGEALESGHLHMMRFSLVIKAVDDVPKELQDVRFEVDDIRILFKANSDYGDPVGIIFQPLEIAGIDISGWLVSVRGHRRSEAHSRNPVCLLSRPAITFYDLLLSSGIKPDSTDNEINDFLNASLDRIHKRIGRAMPPQLHHF